MNSKNEVFEYLIDQLRQQVSNNAYKKQCEDLAHEVQSLKSELARYKKPYIAYVKKTDWVQGGSRFLKKWGKHRADILRECIQEQDAELQSLKNQLRDASAQIKELREDNIKKSEHISHLSGQTSAYRSDALRFQAQVEDLVKRLAIATGDESAKIKELQREISVLANAYPCEPEQFGCRKEDAHECEHDWDEDGDNAMVCKKCGALA